MKEIPEHLENVQVMVAKAYEVYDEESSRTGETSDSGWVYEYSAHSIEDAIREIESEGYVEYAGSWFTTIDSQIDYENGEHTRYSFFLAEDTPLEVVEFIIDALRERGHLFPPN